MPTHRRHAAPAGLQSPVAEPVHGPGMPRRRPAFRAATAFVAGLSAVTFGCGGGDGSVGTASPTPVREAQPDSRLVQSVNLVYEGAFRVPAGASDSSSFAYGGTNLAFNSANQSLYMTGNDVYQLTAELAIPAIRNSSDLGSLATASVLQTFRDASEGKLSGVNPSGGETKVGGYLVYDDRLIFTGYTYYDSTNSQSASHFSRPLSLAQAGQVRGPFALSGAPARWLAGYMAAIPAEWRATFGGPALTGLAGVNIASAASNGPAAAVFDPASPSAAKLLVGYPLEQTLPQQYGTSVDNANPYWNFTSQVRGVVFPDGTRSVLFFGRHGLAAQQYGVDPMTGYKGYFAQPYAYQVWAYDAQELLKVKDGQLQSYAVKPYAVWNFDLPFESNNPGREIGGAAYDPASRRIYLSQIGTDGSQPVIHVLRVNAALQ